MSLEIETDSADGHALDAGVVGLLAGVAAVAGSYAVAGFTPSFVAAPVSRLVVALTPDAVVTWSIQALGDLGHQLGFLLALALTVSLFAATTALAGRVAARLDRRTAPFAAAACFGVAVAVTRALAPSLAAGVAAGLVVAAASFRTGETGEIDGGEVVSSARRRILRAVAAATAVGGVGAVLGTRRGNAPARLDADGSAASDDGGARGLLADADENSLAVRGLDGLVSDNFYQVDINSVDPDVETGDWSLRVTGAVDEEREFDFADLTDRPAEHRFVTLRCVGEPLNGKKMDTALWTGVPVTDLLGEAGLPEECCVMLRAEDGYFEEFPLAALRNGFLAYRMNGEPLPRGHGAPVRVLIPGHWGEINVKWLTEIEVLAEPADGYWEKRGWHGTGPVETVAKLHAVNRLDGGRVQVAGHAYAGTRGIERVEVSTDGGESWTDATLSEPLPGATPADGAAADGGTPDHEAAESVAEDAWRQWEHTYGADQPHEVVVRATDGDGRLQPREQRDSFPSGATGWVSERIEP